LENITGQPHQQKFRTIKTTNPKLASSVFNVKGIEQILMNLGFSQEGTDYVLRGDNTLPDLQKTLILLEGKLSILNAPAATGDQELIKKNQALLAQKQAAEEEMRKLQAERAKANRIDKAAELRDRPPTDSVANELKFGANICKVEFKSSGGRGG